MSSETLEPPTSLTLSLTNAITVVRSTKRPHVAFTYTASLFFNILLRALAISTLSVEIGFRPVVAS